MSVAVSNSTVLSPLWRAGEADGAPASVPVSEDGVFLSFQLQGNGRGPHSTSNASSNNANITTAATTDHEAVTFVAFHPVDETCFVFGTESGRAYGVSLQDNKLFLLANLGSGGGGALRCGIFCPGYLTSPIVVVVKAPHRLVFVDWQRGTVVQEVAHTAHTQPILRLLTGPSTDSLICAVSADAFSCWEPVTNATAAAAPAEPHASGNSPFGAGGRSSRQHGGAAEATATALQSTGAVNAKGGEEKLPTAPRYICTSNAEPTQRTRGSVMGHASVPMHGSKGPHRFLSLHVIEPTLLLSVESNNILSLWSRTQGSGVPAGSLNSGVLENAASGAAARTASRVQLLDSVTAPPTLRVRCSAQCGELIALGADAVATSKRGPVVEPVVAFVHTRTLAGTGVVRLPTSGASSSGAMHVVATNSARATPTVVNVSALHSDLVACLLSTGTVHVVLASTYHLVFTIQPPATATPPSTADAARWSFAPSGPTFGAMFRDRTLALLHLPTARKVAVSASTRSTATRGDVASASLLRSGDTRGDVRRGSPVKAGGIARPSAQRSSAPLSPVTLALPFLRHPRSSKPFIAGTAAFLEDGAAASPSLHHQRKFEAELPAAAQEVLAVCRAPIPVPKRGFPSQWVDVNLVDMRFSDTDGIHAGEDTVGKAEDTSSAPSTSATRALSEQALWSEAKFCDTLSAVSCQYNLEQLQAHLVKFGVFPHNFRRFTWRFLAGLPSRARTASQFAAVARRPRHVAVEQLMRPFPLPHNATRQAVEEALSCLCWAAPVLTLAFYLPVLVYPLVMLYREDVQTVVELALVFFENWGREFFVCHPRGPLSVLTAMERELGRLDAALSQHLIAVGATIDVWGWELMTTFYTDVLTGAEWLQVMDHAFATAPLWLYAFHLSLLRTRLRAPLMAAVSADEVRGVLSHAGSHAGTPTAAATTTSLKVVIEEAYRLHGEVAKRVESGGGETAELAGYTHFRTLSPRFEYPSENLPHDPVIFAEKMRELALVQRRRDEEVAATKRYTALRTEAAAAAAKEATFLQQQRARAAATFDASAAAWQVQVALEKGRQEQEAQEQQLRWEAVQRRTRNAAALASLHTEMRTVESQLRHDMVDRHMEQLKWGLAAHLTEEELARLQQSAEVEVERAVRCIDHDVAVQADTLARFHDEPALQIERPGVDAAESAAEERDIEDTVGDEAVEEETVTAPDGRHDGAADSRTNRGHDSEGGGDAQVEVLAPAGAATMRSSKDDESEARVSRHPAAAPPSSHQTNSTATATSSKSACRDLPVEPSLDGRVSKTVDSEGDAAAGVAAAHAAPSQEVNDGAHGGEADTTTLSANTQRYASPGREGSASAQQQPRVHAAARHHRPPPRRHGSLGSATATTTTSTSSSASCAKMAPSATLQSFVELRNRVLQRLQPANEHIGGNAMQRPHKAPDSSRFPSSSDTAERDAHTSTSYTTSYTTTSSAAEAERSHCHERTPHSTATATTTTSSALWSRSYSTSYSCPSSSYYDYYGTGRTTTSSATSTSHPHTTTP